MRADRTKAEVENIDGEVAQRISDWDGESSLKRHLTNEWVKLTIAEETKSKRIWEKTAKNLRETPHRQQETSKVLDRDGRTYAAVTKKPKGIISSDNQHQNLDPDSSENWNVANSKNKKSHKETIPTKPTPANGDPAKQRAGAGPFHKRGPKFRPKQWGTNYQREWNGGYQGPWGYPAQYQQW